MLNKTEKKEIKTVVDAMLEKKASDVVCLDLRKIGTAITDFFIVCNADSTTQVSAICENVEEKMMEHCSRKLLRGQGRGNALWIILDYSNIVVHIFKSEYRDFYRLEDLWADAQRVVIDE
ncbi:MAG: ribosome silencing factor [Bacteroidales bacterium]|nr:ribosome silencing factor [Bacteroidales bacterium]